MIGYQREIINCLEELIPNADCELVYNHDYELLISVVLSAQTTDVRVNEVTKTLYKKYDTLEKISGASIDDIKQIIKPIGTYERKSRYVKDIANTLIINGYNYIPNDRKFLESLPGVGRKTANVVLGILYNDDSLAVDTHIKRVSIRLGLANANDDVRIIEDKLCSIFKDYEKIKVHHMLLLFGRYYCKAKKPLCNDCKLKFICNYYKEREEEYEESN